MAMILDLLQLKNGEEAEGQSSMKITKAS